MSFWGVIKGSNKNNQKKRQGIKLDQQLPLFTPLRCYESVPQNRTN